MRLVIFPMVSLALLLSPAESSACDCAGLGVKGSIDLAVIVATGRVTSMAENEWGSISVKVAVREILKGKPGTSLSIQADRFGSSCYGYDFNVGKDYLLFASRNRDRVVKGPPGSYVVYLCSGTSELSGRETSEPSRGEQLLEDVRKALASRKR